jgi:hypothetical protein
MSYRRYVIEASFGCTYTGAIDASELGWIIILRLNTGVIMFCGSKPQTKTMGPTQRWRDEDMKEVNLVINGTS